MNVATTLFLASFFAFQVPVPGQEGEAPKVRYEKRQEGTFEILQFADGRSEERLLPEDEAVMLRRDNKEMFGITKAEHIFDASAHPKPRRMAPGQTGELWVVVTLTKPHVVLPDSHIKLKLEPDKLVTYGTPVLEPARLGELEQAFKGKPVYDDALVFKLPFTVSANAKLYSKLYVKGRMELELHDGKGGANLGKYYTEVGGLIQVGKPIPTPNVTPTRKTDPAGAVGTEGPPSSATRDDGSAVGTQPAPGKAKPEGGANATTTGRVESAPGPRREPSGADPVLPADPLLGAGKGGISMLTWAFGGAVVVLLALLLVARRR